MSDTTNPSASDASTDSDGPLRLRDAQRRIRDAYFAHDSGVFVLNCNPGVGKSVTTTDVAAEELLRRFADGDPTPEQHVCVISFTRDDAASFVPGVIERLRELVEHDVTPAAKAVSTAELESLVTRVRHAPYIGTIDSVFRSIMEEFVAEVGFDEMPDIGSEGRLDRIHAECYEELVSDPTYESAIDVVRSAYPSGEYEDGPAELLRQALHQCRARRLTTNEFEAELRATVDAVYAEGETTSFDDVGVALARCVDPDAAVDACTSVDASDREQIVAADQQLRSAWIETIEAFCTLLDAYRDEYTTLTRDHGVISHTDCAFLVAEIFTGNYGQGDLVEAKRERVLARYRSHIESIIIDEAQDVSELQHAALAPLITDECRVLAAGDLRQSIYVWRDAHPSIFERAVKDGQYFGNDWDTHVTETAAATYRCTPDIAAAINAIAAPALTNPSKGNLGNLDVTFTPLNAVRDSTTEPNVHIAAFESAALPGSPAYVDPDTGKGEAGILATYIAAGLADGTLDDAQDTESCSGCECGEDECPETGDGVVPQGSDRCTEVVGDGDPSGDETDTDGDGDGDDVGANVDNGDQPEVTVLFRWRTHMLRYARAFQAEGLTVANASTYLFDCPAVTTVLDVAQWLVNPADPERLQALVTDSSLGLGSLEDDFEAQDWRLDAVRDAASIEATDRQRDVLDRLYRLRERRPAVRAQPAATTIADIIEIMALRADPNDVAATVAPSQRIANLDTLVELVRDWTDDSTVDLADAVELLAPIRNEPHTGPTQPVTNTEEHDVVFKTIHQAKGDENDVVALADLGWNLRKLGPTSKRFVATGPMIGLAPPANAAAPDIGPLAAFTRGLYNPEDDDDRFGPTPYPRDVGLRWASEHWTDTHTGTTPDTRQGTDASSHSAAKLVGHERVQTATRLTRAEAWRLLYVALTRAKHHLVLPLPRTVPGPAEPRDRWLETVRDGLQFDGTPTTGTYTLDVESPDDTTRSIDVAVNDVDALTTRTTQQSSPTSTPLAATTPPDRNTLPALVPRFLRPSTLYPLTEDRTRYLLDHLQGRPLHTDTDTVDDDLPLTLDAFDTEAVGQFVHDVLTTAVKHDVSAPALRTVNDEVQQIIDDQLHHHGPPTTDAERNGLLTFLTEDILPTVVESDLWTQLEQATDVYVEKRLRGHVRRNDVEFELEGQADFVLRHPDGSWTITDTKIALTDQHADTQQRYRVQVTCYAWLLAHETNINNPTTITTAIETFGAVNDRTIESPSPSIIQDRLDELLTGGR